MARLDHASELVLQGPEGCQLTKRREVVYEVGDTTSAQAGQELPPSPSLQTAGLA